MYTRADACRASPIMRKHQSQTPTANANRMHTASTQPTTCTHGRPANFTLETGHTDHLRPQII
jgi:hypothetical protein